MFTIFFNSTAAPLGFLLPEQFIVLVASLLLVVMAGIARRMLTKELSKTSEQVQANLNIHTSKIGEKTT